MNFFNNITNKPREVKVSIEKIKANIIWINKNYAPIKEWLTLKQKSSKSSLINSIYNISFKIRNFFKI